MNDQLRRLAFMSAAGQDPTEMWFTLVAFAECKPKRILEVGVYKGGFTQTLLAAFPYAHVTGIEYNELKSQHPRLTIVTGDSHEKEVIEQVRGLGPFDCIMIDGDHTLDGVRQDWENYSPMCREGGVIAIHDVNTAVDIIEVHQFLPEIDDLPHVDIIAGKRTPGVRLVFRENLPRMDVIVTEGDGMPIKAIDP